MLPITGHVFSSMVMLVVENDMQAEIYGLLMVVRVLVEMKDWPGDL
jgi:hypothetical protein